MKESSNGEVEVADWIYLIGSPVSTEHSKTNFLDALQTPKPKAAGALQTLCSPEPLRELLR